jgi:hypothetical protein
MRYFVGASMLAVVTVAIWASPAGAWPTYSDSATIPRTGNCATCHGDFFRATPYVSLSESDATSWGTTLMSGHESFMNSTTSCNVCHQAPPASKSPVFLGLSAGIPNYSPIACLGCHGRNEDAPNMGAGLRLHHANKGITVCAECHVDNVPAGENAQPPYYFSDSAMPNKPIDPCNLAPPPGNENKFGSKGLDNDGDLLYDTADPNCAAATPTQTATQVATATPTVPPTATPTQLATATPTVPPTPTPTQVATATPTVPPTATPTGVATATPTVPATATPTQTPAQTTTPTPTSTPNLATKCDLNHDGKVDINDISLILSGRGLQVTDDPRDIDGNGRISVKDARACALQCTQPKCLSRALSRARARHSSLPRNGA